MNNKVIDLFGGVGGFSLGAFIAGFEPVLCIDNDKDLTSSCEINFPRTRQLLCDLSTLDPFDFAQVANVKPGELAGIIGGPPCQGFSYIGKRDLHDPRNQLVTKFFLYVKHARPRFFVMENVPGLLSEPHNPILFHGIECLGSDYQVLEPLILDAADYGAATTRRRVFVIGYRKEHVDSISVAELKSNRSAQRATVRDAILDLPRIDSFQENGRSNSWASYSSEPSCEYARDARRLPMPGLSNNEVMRCLKLGIVSGSQITQHTPEVITRFSKVSPGQTDEVSRCRRLAWFESCPTLRAGTGRDRGSYQALRPIHPEQDRVITVREAARLQGFPDWFQFHATKWHSFRMIGNSVSPQIAKAILSLIAQKLGILQPKSQNSNSP